MAKLRHLSEAWETLRHEAIYPYVAVWKLERARVLVFGLSALLLAQVQLAAVFFTGFGPLPSGIDAYSAIGIALAQQLDGANFYLFSATLLLSTCASLGSEWLDSANSSTDKSTVKESWKWRFYGWALVAVVLALVQMVGAIKLNDLALQEAFKQPDRFELLTSGNLVQLSFWLFSMAFVMMFFAVGRVRHHPSAQEDLDKRTRDTIASAAEVDKSSDEEKL